MICNEEDNLFKEHSGTFFFNYHVSHYYVLGGGVFRKTPVAENEASAPGGDETKQADS